MSTHSPKRCVITGKWPLSAVREILLNALPLRKSSTPIGDVRGTGLPRTETCDLALTSVVAWKSRKLSGGSAIGKTSAISSTRSTSPETWSNLRRSRRNPSPNFPTRRPSTCPRELGRPLGLDPRLSVLEDGADQPTSSVVHSLRDSRGSSEFCRDVSREELSCCVGGHGGSWQDRSET